jgi:CPA1 family monovalent cation:H+ antiporter
MSQTVNCPHAGHARIDPAAVKADVCEECARTGGKWVALRVCLECGHVGCCDSSPGRHARRHGESSGHPLIAPAGQGESWRWCYIDDRYV